MAAEEGGFVEALAAEPVGHLLVALTGVAGAAGGDDVLEGVAASAGDGQDAVALEGRAGGAAVGAAAPGILESGPLAGAEVVLDAGHAALAFAGGAEAAGVAGHGYRVTWISRIRNPYGSGAAARYDSGMTRSKIAISVPAEQLAIVHREVRAGRADSVSGYISTVLAEHSKRESVRALLRDLIEQYGKPSGSDVKWAERALAKRKG